MILYPQLYLEHVTQITLELLQEHHIKGLILDVDNTLIDYYRHLSEETINWCKMLQENGIKMCILSNSNKQEKVKQVAKTLQLPYRNFALKPLKTGFKKAQNMLNLQANEIAVVGDQIFTDVVGANRCHMFSILVKPIQEKDLFITVIKRPIENKIIKSYQKKQNTK